MTFKWKFRSRRGRTRRHIEKDLEKRARINSLVYRVGYDRGIASEERAGVVLESLRQRRVIQDFVPSVRFSELDRQGIDFVIIDQHGRRLPLQVKSSWRAAFVHEAQNLFMGGEVTPCLVVSPNRSDEKMADWICRRFHLC